jgi:hypothetical protein
MEDIIFIHDDMPGNSNALMFAVSMAERMGTRVLLARTHVTQHARREKLIAGNTAGQPTESSVNNLSISSQSVVREINISAMVPQQLIQKVNKDKIRMLIKVAGNFGTSSSALNLTTLLKGIHCPLLLIPESFVIKDLKSLVHIDETYANQLFDEQVRRLVKYDRLFFNYTRERNLIKAVDVLTNGMHHDALVMTWNRYHFNGLIGHITDGSMPCHISVPLLIFPG